MYLIMLLIWSILKRKNKPDSNKSDAIISN